MTDVVNTLTREIEKHRLRLTELEEQRSKLETELPLVKANLDALMRSLLIIQGKSVETPAEEVKEPSSSLPDRRSGMRKGSMTDMAYSILKEAGTTLTINDLFQRVKAQKPNLGKNSFTSSIYHLSRQRKIFRVHSGKIRLLE